MKMLLRKSEKASPFSKIPASFIENEITGWNEIFGKAESLIRITFKRKQAISVVKPLVKHLHSSFEQKRAELRGSSRNLTFSSEKSRVLQEKNKKRRFSLHDKERYTFIKKKSISQLESLMKALEPKIPKPPSSTLPKSKHKKRHSQDPAKPISPIFSLFPNAKFSKFLPFRTKH